MTDKMKHQKNLKKYCLLLYIYIHAYLLIIKLLLHRNKRENLFHIFMTWTIPAILMALYPLTWLPMNHLQIILRFSDCQHVIYTKKQCFSPPNIVYTPCKKSSQNRNNAICIFISKQASIFLKKRQLKKKILVEWIHCIIFLYSG